MFGDRLGFKLGRLKTGTPPRLDGSTIDWSKCFPQEGDSEPTPFSFVNRSTSLGNKVTCFSTHTNEKTVDLVQKVRHLSADKQVGSSVSGDCVCDNDIFSPMEQKLSHPGTALAWRQRWTVLRTDGTSSGWNLR